MIKCGKRIVVISSLLFLSACAGLSRTESYLAVVDAGSSGSRIYLYKANSASGSTDIQDLAQIHPHGLDGLSSYEGNTGQAGPQGIRPLLDSLDAYLAANDISKNRVAVEVLATAGMRLLEQGNPPAAQAIYRSVRETIAGDGYQSGQIRTISGADEGLYSWADVNYLYRNFQPNRATAGIVEVGGASAQVAYATSDASHPHAVRANINGVSYAVLSVSYLGLGQNEARKAMIVASGLTRNVCYPNNDNGSPPVSFNADTGSPAYVVASGDYRFAACDDVYQTLLASFHVRSSAVAPGFEATRFVGIASVFHALHDWGVLDYPAMLETRLATHCAGLNAWSLKVAPMQGGTSKFAQNACANGTFIHALLFGPDNGLGLPGGRLTGVERINGMAPTWTRGYALIRSAE